MVRRLFCLAIQDVRAKREGIRFQVFEKYDLSFGCARPTYLQLAKEFGITPETVTNYLAAMRRDFRAAVLNRLRDLTAPVTGCSMRSAAAVWELSTRRTTLYWDETQR
jgi:hypothetical protein